MRSYFGRDHVADADDVITYHSLSVQDIDFGDEDYEIVEVGDVKIYFTSPEQLDMLALVATEAAASLRQSLSPNLVSREAA